MQMKSISFFFAFILALSTEQNTPFFNWRIDWFNKLKDKICKFSLNDDFIEFDGQLLKDRLNVFTPLQQKRMMIFSNMFKTANSELYLVAPKGILGFEVAYAILISNKRLTFITEEEKKQIKNGIIIETNKMQKEENVPEYVNRISELIKKKEKTIVINDFFIFNEDPTIKAYLNYEVHFKNGKRRIRNLKEQPDKYLTAEYLNTIITNKGETKDYFDDVFTSTRRFEQFSVRKKTTDKNNKN